MGRKILSTDQSKNMALSTSQKLTKENASAKNFFRTLYQMISHVNELERLSPIVRILIPLTTPTTLVLQVRTTGRKLRMNIIIWKVTNFIVMAAKRKVLCCSFHKLPKRKPVDLVSGNFRYPYTFPEEKSERIVGRETWEETKKCYWRQQTHGPYSRQSNFTSETNINST